MAEPNIYELIVDELVDRQRLVRDELRQRFKHNKPFRQELMSNEEMLYDYDTRGFEIFSEIADTKGIDEAIIYRDQMEKLKQRKAGR